jgi:murein DD-endopeptidase MepM/ murein hydrolase activator NlpD
MTRGSGKKPGFLNSFRPRLTGRSFFWQRGLIGKRAAGEMSLGDSSMAAAATDKKPTLLERVWDWLHRTFPERQIYIRSDGRVQFFTFGPSLQATMAGLVLIFLGWVAFATVNVVFKDRIIAAKDHRFQQMQSAYEGRLADLQISYDDLNGALVGAEDKFKATADGLTARQNAISGFLSRKTQVEAQVGVRDNGAAIREMPSSGATQVQGLAESGAASDSVGYNGTSGDSEDADSTLSIMPGPALPQPRVQVPAAAGHKASLLDDAWKRIGQFASALFKPRGPSQRRISSAYAQNPALQQLAAQTARLAALQKGETQMMEKTQIALMGDVGLLRDSVRRTGLNPDAFIRRVRSGQGMGGPDIALDQVHVDGSNDPQFDQAYLRASAVLNELNTLSSEVGHIPMQTPVAGAAFDRSSGFGARLDPFTGQYAFHPGVDFAGPWGAAVTATAPGVVIFAGDKGGYGNMVEIDHGFGFHTRYGHLSRITVGVGANVGIGAVVGRLGSTGRSTGPHVHYEVWYDDKVRNPSNFIEAGHHVL